MEGSLKLNVCPFSHVPPSAPPRFITANFQKAEISPHSLLPFLLLAGGLGAFDSLTVLVPMEDFFILENNS